MIAQVARVFLYAVAFVCGANTAHASFVCRALETHRALPAVQGEDGVFFAIRPELQSHHGLEDDTISLLSQLNVALATRGTTLVLLQVPTRAQVLTHQLPMSAHGFGFDPEASIAVHLDMNRRLKMAGITVADPLVKLRVSALSGALPFFQTDPRPTTLGTRILANSVGSALADHPNLEGVKRGAYRTTPGGVATLRSEMRLQLQTACETELPKVATQTFTTLRIQDDAATKDTKSNNRLALLGTDFTGTPELNLPGFLSEATGLEVLSYGVAEGGAFSAMSSYLTSADFQNTPPRVLVWEMPVSVSMATHGDQPMRELIAAAANDCALDFPLTEVPNNDRLRADLSLLPKDAEITLALDTGRAEWPYVRFHFTGDDGAVRTRSIYRHPGQILTGNFYLPLSGLNTSGLKHVEIEGPVAFGLQPRLAGCL